MKASRVKVSPSGSRIPLTIIERAKQCDLEAMEQILCFYKAYMRQLCKIDLYDASGNPYTCFDEEMFHELESKLMMAILTKFKVQ